MVNRTDTSTNTDSGSAQSPAAPPGNRSTRPPSWDKERVKDAIVPVCAHYLGPGRTLGVRTAWTCPACQKEKFEVNALARIGGCWNTDCPLPATTDALGLIAYFESLDLRAGGFREALRKGYEIIGLPDPVTEKQLNRSNPAPGFDTTGSGSTAPRKPPTADAATPTSSSLSGSPARTHESPGAARPNAHHSIGAHPPRSTSRASQAGYPDVAVPRSPDPRTAVHSGTTSERSPQVRGTYSDSLLGPARRPPADGTSIPDTHALDPSLAESHSDSAQLRHAVYEALLAICPPTARDEQFWAGRWVTPATMRQGRFGSITAPLARRAAEHLAAKFGEEALLSVPGFSRTETGRLRFTLTGNYTLIPYHDQNGLITTIEGRFVGDGDPPMGKYVSLRNSGAHLYVFPGIDPTDLEAFVEGTIGAIVAAQEGIRVGAIKGFRNYKQPGSDGGPLPELRGVDFGGRTVPYIPDVDDPPRTEVMQEAPKAAAYLAGLQNGRQALTVLPQGKDLDEWLLALPKPMRRSLFDDLLKNRTVPLDRPTSEPAILDPATPEPLAGEHLTENTTTPHPEPQHPPGTPRPELPNHTSPRRRRRVKPPPATQPEPVRLTGTPHAAPSAKQADTQQQPDQDPWSVARAPVSKPDLTTKVFEALLELSGLNGRDLGLWAGLGVSEDLAREGRFASMSEKRARKVLSELASTFGSEALSTVPGFGADNSGRLTFMASGDYALVPYLDACGCVNAIEALPVGRRAGEEEYTIAPHGNPMFLSSRGADHLYVFPSFKAGDLEAICEGIMGAIVAAASGIPVGAIRAPGCFSAPSGTVTLPELEGAYMADASGRPRRVVYIPHVPDPPEQRVLKLAPEAAARLISRHGGEAALLPDPLGRGTPDLATWLLSFPKSNRRPFFDALLTTAKPLEEAEIAAFGVARDHRLPDKQSPAADSVADEPAVTPMPAPVPTPAPRPGLRPTSDTILVAAAGAVCFLLMAMLALVAYLLGPAFSPLAEKLLLLSLPAGLIGALSARTLRTGIRRKEARMLRGDID